MSFTSGLICQTRTNVSSAVVIKSPVSLHTSIDVIGLAWAEISHSKHLSIKLNILI